MNNDLVSKKYFKEMNFSEKELAIKWNKECKKIKKIAE